MTFDSKNILFIAVLYLLMTIISVSGQPCITYDYVVAGGGAVGAAIAAKLANTGASVIVLEQGGDNCTACYTSLTTETTLASPPYISKLLSKEQEFLDGRGNILYGFKGLGGGTQIYGGVNNRATPEQLAKNPPGYQYANLLPYFKQLEDHYCYYLPESYTGISPASCLANHGQNGPMHVQIADIGVSPQFDQDFISAAKNGTFGPAAPFTTDYNAPTTRQGMAWIESFRNIVGSKSDPNAPRTRGNTYNNYLLTARQQNLRIVTFAKVLKLIISSKNVYGVTYNLNGRDGPYIALARKEVILAMGVYETPKFLELNGIGDPAILAQFGIPLVASNPAVGTGLKAHQTVLLGYQTTGPIVVNQTLNGDGSLIGFLKAPNSPELQGALQLGFIEGEETNSFDNAFTGPDPIAIAGGTEAVFTGAPASSLYSVFICNTNPKINGTVHIQSKNSEVEPLVDLGWTNAAFNPATSPDYQDLIYGLTVMRSILGGNNTFAKKWIVQEVYPGTRYSSAYSLVAPAVPPVYVGPLSEENHIQHDLNTVYHTGCTVALGKATDLNGAVLGVRGLTVVGNALLPVMSDGNPTTLSIALSSLAIDRMLATNGGTSKTILPDLLLEGFCFAPLV